MACQGDTEFVLWPDDANGYSGSWIKQKGSQIIGDTYFGSVGLVNLQINGGDYLGYLGGDAGSDMKCQGSSCNGYIGGETAYYTITQKTVKGVPATVIDGSINFYHFTATRTADSIEIYSTGAGYLKLDKVRDGLFQGQAIYTSGPYLRTFRAQLTTSGKILDDNTIFTFFLAAPLCVSSDRAAGLGP